MMVLRINAALVFLSLCLGDVLVQFVSGDTNSFLGTFTGHNASTQLIKLGLLLLPVILTALFMVRTIKGSRIILNILPATGVGLLGALLAVPLLPRATAVTIMNSGLWQTVQRGQDLIVGSSALVCLFVLWLLRPKSGWGKRSKHHK